MHRIEIVANRSVKDDIIEGLESGIPGILYTVVPEAEGKGSRDRKLGTTTWPELNFVLVAYVAEWEVDGVKSVIRDVKGRFPNEGIAYFAVRAEEA